VRAKYIAQIERAQYALVKQPKNIWPNKKGPGLFLSNVEEKSMSKFSLCLLSLLMVLFSLIFMGQAQAATCNFNSLTNVAFGFYDVFNASPTDSAGNVQIRCTYNPSRNVTMSIGTSPNTGGFNPRAMKLTTGTDLLNYNLYTTAARNIIWGNGTQGTQTVVKNCPRNTNVDFPVYGRITALQDVSIGSYSDTLVVTISF
jgi:spore coat protein U-like protein